MTHGTDIALKPKLNPMIASLPPHLKDPANYEKVRKLIVEALAGKCSHSEMMDWAACADCQQRFHNKRAVLKSLGFKNPRQYMAWQKIHEHIKSRVHFAKYNEPK